MVPVIEGLVAAGALVSVDTYKPAVAEAAVRGGGGDRQRRLGPARARAGGGLRGHRRGARDHCTRAWRRRARCWSPAATTTWSPTSRGFLRERMDVALARGGGGGADPARPRPGLRQDARADGRGAAAPRRGARARAPGAAGGLAQGLPRRAHRRAARASAARRTLAALAHGVDAGAHVLRVHDVAAAADFLAVRAALRGERELAPGEGLTPDRYPDGEGGDVIPLA